MFGRKLGVDSTSFLFIVSMTLVKLFKIKQFNYSRKPWTAFFFIGIEELIYFWSLRYFQLRGFDIFKETYNFYDFKLFLLIMEMSFLAYIYISTDVHSFFKIFVFSSITRINLFFMPGIDCGLYFLTFHVSPRKLLQRCQITWTCLINIAK